MEQVSAEMKHFFVACEMLLHDMSPQDFSEKECNLIEHYGLELFSRYCRSKSQGAIINCDKVDKSQPQITDE